MVKVEQDKREGCAVMRQEKVERGPGWRLGVTLVTAFAVLYAIVDGSTQEPVPGVNSSTGASQTLEQNILSAFQVTTSGDVPSSVETAVVSRLQNVKGANELVVTPSSSGAGYDVSATVDLGDDENISYGTWAAMVKQDLPSYFEGVFGSGQPIQQADVYFLLDGQIVAGAALGATAYQTIDSATSANGSNWVTAMAGLPVDTTEGPNARWFEMEPTGP